MELVTLVIKLLFNRYDFEYFLQDCSGFLIDDEEFVQFLYNIKIVNQIE